MEYLNEAPQASPAQLKEVERLETEAKDAKRREEESFERCDTDGFLSQWANSMTASLNRRKIEILKNGGYARFDVLVHAETGWVIATKDYYFPNKFKPWTENHVWRVEDKYLDLTNGRKWIPCGRTSKVQKSFALTEEKRWFKAHAKLTVARGAKSTGLSGCANAFVGVFKGDE